MKIYLLIFLIFFFIFNLSGKTDRIYPGFFPSKANIQHLKIDVQKSFIRFSKIRKHLTPAMLTNPTITQPHDKIKNGLINIKTMINNQNFIDAHKLLFDLTTDFENLEVITNKDNRIIYARNALLDFRDSVTKQIKYINSLKPINFTELIKAKKKIKALEQKLVEGKLAPDEYRLIYNMMESYIIRYDYYRDLNNSKKLLEQSRKLQKKLNSIWLKCKSMRKNPNLDNLVNNLYHQTLDCNILLKQSKFIESIKKLKVVIRSQTIAIEKFMEIANAWKLELHKNSKK
ncbi:hypothetical protein KAJ27_20825 [bacterium]|nr:hypothetical protein [bacterium]